MSEHLLLLIIFLLSAVVITTVAVLVFISTIRTDDTGTEKPGKKRAIFAVILGAIAVIFLSVTIPKSPYYLHADDTPAKVVFVNSLQYAFMMSYEAIEPDMSNLEPVIEVPVNEVVEFRVTSLDVNHGFAIYNENAELITQTQAMPGYVNRLRWKFTEPGTYEILCLEYCGLGHSFMRSTFIVK